ncbi:MAG: cytochrome c-type biogenesis protein [Terriglobia bacterium]
MTLALFGSLGSLGLFGSLSWAQEEAVDEAAFRRVSNRLLCQCGCGYMVLSCNHLDCPSATYIRRTIRTSLAAGQTEEAAFQVIVDQYGPKILPEPPRAGFAWMAWLMPFAALFLGGGAVSYVLWRWKKGPSTPSTEEFAEGGAAPGAPGAPSEPVPAATVEKYRAQIDRDLENE